jgi:hypothetical protein
MLPFLIESINNNDIQSLTEKNIKYEDFNNRRE